MFKTRGLCLPFGSLPLLGLLNLKGFLCFMRGFKKKFNLSGRPLPLLFCFQSFAFSCFVREKALSLLFLRSSSEHCCGEEVLLCSERVYKVERTCSARSLARSKPPLLRKAFATRRPYVVGGKRKMYNGRGIYTQTSEKSSPLVKKRKKRLHTIKCYNSLNIQIILTNKKLKNHLNYGFKTKNT